MAMAKRSSSHWFAPFSFILFPRGSDSLCYLLALISLLSLLLHHLSLSSSASPTAPSAADFEGFDSDEAYAEDDIDDQIPLRSSPPPTLTHSDPETHHGPPSSTPDPAVSTPSVPDSPPKPSSAAFDFWDEDEFEGLPVVASPDSPVSSSDNTASDNKSSDSPSSGEEKKFTETPPAPRSYVVEIVCVSFLIMFAVNYFTGKKENENIALAWAAKFATKDSIFEKNFSFLGVGKEEDSPLLLKEGQNVFKFYASGRRYCQGLLATMELKSRHDLISRMYNMVVPCRDEISFEVYLNDDAMDHVVFALAKKKAAKGMQKELRDLQKFAGFVSQPSNRKWVAEDLSVISESKEVAGDLITEAVLDQVFGDKAFEKFGKGFISMHFSDQLLGTHKKILLFKFALPAANNMADMTRLVALIPYYIDFIGRYKLSSQARSKTETARVKAAQEAYKELQSARQDAIQKKKAERKRMSEEAEAKLGAEALRKKEAKAHARQMKKAMPKMKMTRAH